MLATQIRDEEIRGLKRLSDAGVYAERLLSADTLKGEFEHGVIRRKLFCEALDIGESTLSTWLQTDRVPRVAALAYVLWLALKKQGDELRRRDELAAEPYVIRCREGYAVVQPSDGTEGVVGQIIDQVETAERAREIAVARSGQFRRILDDAINALEKYAESLDGDAGWVEDRISALERAKAFQVGPMTLDEVLTSTKAS